MTGEELADRYDSIYAGVTYDDLRRAELTTTHEAKFQKALTEQGKLTGEGSITMARSSVHTIADIEQKAVEVDATIVFIDSVYLFDADRDSPQGEVQRRMAISQRCKRTAQELDIPVIVSTQAGRRDGKAKQPSLDNIEWSNAFSQDANVVMELDRDDIDKELNQGWVYLLKCRQGQPTDAAINMDFTFMKFDQKDIQKEPTFEAFSEEEKEDVPWMS
jgi:replicative DNA helicase